MMYLCGRMKIQLYTITKFKFNFPKTSSIPSSSSISISSSSGSSSGSTSGSDNYFVLGCTIYYLTNHSTTSTCSMQQALLSTTTTRTTRTRTRTRTGSIKYQVSSIKYQLN